MTRASISRTVSSLAWYCEDTMPIKICPLRAWTQSSLSTPSPIPSGDIMRKEKERKRVIRTVVIITSLLSLCYPSKRYHRSSSCSCRSCVWWGWWRAAPPRRTGRDQGLAPHTCHSVGLTLTLAWACRQMLSSNLTDRHAGRNPEPSFCNRRKVEQKTQVSQNWRILSDEQGNIFKKMKYIQLAIIQHLELS